ncbi:MAG: Holliday junction branch migration protein RuvA [Synergistaceae bacterium]|nr:Holliday junction branch migration protein RuvA [Synergistaceae bacterium]
MINSLRGIVLSIGEDCIVLDVAGFGLEVFITRSLLEHAVIDEELVCYAYLQISDSGLSMFGFSTELERTLFLELLQVKTVGGKLAITLLRHFDAEQVLMAIMSGSAAMLSVPGLGAKRAERICFELKNKIEKKFSGMLDSGTSVSFGATLDSFVMEALTGLGFSQGESARAISLSKADSETDKAWTEESLLKASLGILQRR